MRLTLSGTLLLLLAACAKSPAGPFDAGWAVHVIITADPQPKRGVRVEPVCTLGPQVASSREFLIGPQGAPAVEVATFLVPTGKHWLAVWEPRTKANTSGEFKVQQETWVVVTLEPDDASPRMKAYDRPPDHRLGAWRPLVAVPD